MSEEKLKQILKEIGRTDVPPEAALIAGRVSRNFDAALKIARPKQWIFTPARFVAAAAVVILVFVTGRWSKSLPQVQPSDEIAAYAQRALQNNPDSFWRQKAIAAMQSKPTVQTNLSYTEKLNDYKRYLKEKRYE
jgi:hypothetical protein